MAKPSAYRVKQAFSGSGDLNVGHFFAVNNLIQKYPPRKVLQFLIGFDFTSILVSLHVADRDTFYKAPPLVANFHVEQCGR